MVWSEDGLTRLWSSNDCVNASSIDLRTLVPGRPVAFAVTWGERTTTPGCRSPRTLVPAGTYRLMVRLDNLISPPTPFIRAPLDCTLDAVVGEFRMPACTPRSADPACEARNAVLKGCAGACWLLDELWRGAVGLVPDGEPDEGTDRAGQARRTADRGGRGPVRDGGDRAARVGVGRWGKCWPGPRRGVGGAAAAAPRVERRPAQGLDAGPFGVRGAQGRRVRAGGAGPFADDRTRSCCASAPIGCAGTRRTSCRSARASTRRTGPAGGARPAVLLRGARARPVRGLLPGQGRVHRRPDPTVPADRDRSRRARCGTGAAAAAFGASFAGWIAVLATAGTACRRTWRRPATSSSHRVLAHRQELRQIGAAAAVDGIGADELKALAVRAERVISVENQGWMAKLAEDPPAQTAPEPGTP